MIDASFVAWVGDARHVGSCLSQGGFQGGVRDLARLVNILPVLSNHELSEIVEVIMGILTARAERRETAA